jgi:hypothetical protein
LKTLTAQKLLSLTLAFILCELVLMPLIFYWQPWFQNFTGSLKGFGLGIVFIVFQFAMMFAGMYFARISHLPVIHRPLFWGGLWAVYCAVLIGIKFTNGYVYSILAFCALEVCFVIGEGAMKAAMNHELPSDVRATYLSFVSLLRKVGGLLGLLAIGYFLRGKSENFEDLRVIFGVIGVAGLISFLALLRFHSVRGKIPDIY